MIRLLKFLLTGSWHECRFVIVDRHKTNTWQNSYDSRPTRIDHTYVSRCEVCGKIHSKTVGV